MPQGINNVKNLKYYNKMDNEIMMRVQPGCRVRGRLKGKSADWEEMLYISCQIVVQYMLHW